MGKKECDKWLTFLAITTFLVSAVSFLFYFLSKKKEKEENRLK